MTAHKETIAELVGKLIFQVDPRQLQRFSQLMMKAGQQMRKLGADYTKLAQQMSKTIRIKVDTTAIDKAKQKLQQSLNRELRAETALQNAKRTTFASELGQQKLRFNGIKKESTLASALVQDQRKAAVIAAKAYAQQQKASGVSKQDLATQTALVAAQTKQARLQQIHARSQAITARRDQQHLLAMGKLKQVQAVTARIAAQQRQQSLVGAARLQALQVAAQNKQTNHNNAQQKFQWAQANQQQWVANQAARAAKASSGGGGFDDMFSGGIGGIGMGIARAMGPVGLGLAGVAAALTVITGKLSERIEKRQEGVIEAQTFNNKFTGLSKNPEIVKQLREGYINSQNVNAGAIDNDTASDFRVLASNMIAAKKTPKEILEMWDLRQSAFAVAGTSKDDNRELNKQLNQLASDGTGTKADADIINNRMPMILPYVVEEYMKENKIKDYNKGLKAFNKDLKGGNGIKSSWYEGAFKALVANGADSLKTNRESVASNLTRGESQVFLQDNGINSDPLMAIALNERTEAHRKLTESMLTVNQEFERLDRTLTNFNTGGIELLTKFMNFLNKKETPDAETPHGPTSVGAALGTPLNKQSEQRRLEGNATDSFANKLRRWATGTTLEQDQALAEANRNNGSWGKLDFGPDILKGGIELNKGPYGMFSAMKLSDEGMRQRFGNFQDYIAPPSLQTFLPSAMSTIGSPVINIEGANIHIELTGGATEEDRVKVMESVKTQLDERDRELPNKVGQAIQDLLGDARSQQYQNQ